MSQFISNSNQAVSPANAFVQLNQIAAESTRFHQVELVRTNTNLYRLLGSLYEYYLQISADPGLMDAVLVEIAQSLKENGKRPRKEASVLSALVKYVFRIERQRVHNYKRCLEAALEKNVPPKGFVAFITSEGGVEACKKSCVVKPMADKECGQKHPKVHLENAISMAPIATVSLPADVLQQAGSTGLTLLVAKPKGNGEIDILAVIAEPTSAITSLVMKQLGKTNDGANGMDSKQAAEEALQAAINSAQLITKQAA